MLLGQVRRLASSKAIRVSALVFLAVSFNAAAGVVTARLLIPGDRGLVAILLSAAGIVAVASGLGTNVALRVQLPRGEADLSGYWRLSAKLLAVVGLPSLIAVAVLSSVAIDERILSVEGLASFLAFGVANYVRFQAHEALNAVGRMRTASALSAGSSAVLVLELAALAMTGQGSVFSVTACYSVALGAEGVAAAALLRRERLMRIPGCQRRLLALGPTTLGYHLGQDLVYRVDRYLIGVLGSTGAAGLYAVAATPAELMRIPVNSVAQFVMLDSARGITTGRAAFRTAGYAFLALLAITPVAWWAAPTLIRFMYGDAYAPAAETMRILLLAQVALAPYLVLSRALVGQGATWSSSATGLLGLMVMVVGSVTWVPKLGAEGAAIACVMAFATMSLTSSLILLWRTRTAKRAEPGA